MAVDLPAVGELAWKVDEAVDIRFHNSARGALWLGETLAGEWAEAVAAVCQVLRKRAPSARIHILAECEAAFAALLVRALRPEEKNLRLTEFDCPSSLREAMPPSLVWCVPNFLAWGDLDRLRVLADHGATGS